MNMEGYSLSDICDCYNQNYLLISGPFIVSSRCLSSRTFLISDWHFVHSFKCSIRSFFSQSFNSPSINAEIRIFAFLWSDSKMLPSPHWPKDLLSANQKWLWIPCYPNPPEYFYSLNIYPKKISIFKNKMSKMKKPANNLRDSYYAILINIDKYRL